MTVFWSRGEKVKPDNAPSQSLTRFCRRAVLQLRGDHRARQRLPQSLLGYLLALALHKAVQAIEDANFGQVYVDKIGPEQLRGFRSGGYRLSGMSGDAPYRYEKHLDHKTVYLPYADFPAPRRSIHSS